MNVWTTVRLLALLLACMSVAFGSQKPTKNKFGRLVLALKSNPEDFPAKLNRTSAVIKDRCIRFQIRCTIQPQRNHLSIEFSSSFDLERVKTLLLGQGLQVRAVDSAPFPTTLSEYETREEALEAADGKEVFPLMGAERETFLVVKGSPILTGDHLRNCVVLRDNKPLMYRVDCRLRPAGAARLEIWTGANINSYLAVVFNGRAMSVAYVIAPISLNMEVSAIFGRNYAREVANIFESGNLPVPFDIVHEEIRP